MFHKINKDNIDGLDQQRRNIANALELRLPCT